MSKLTTKAFWVDAGVRALKTLVQTAVGLLTVDSTTPANLSWKEVALASLVAAGMSLYQSLVHADDKEVVKAEPAPTDTT